MTIKMDKNFVLEIDPLNFCLRKPITVINFSYFNIEIYIMYVYL